MRRPARPLIGQEENRRGQLPRVGERGPARAVLHACKRFDAGVDDQECSVDAVLPQLERGCLRDRPDPEGSSGLEGLAGCVPYRCVDEQQIPVLPQLTVRA